MHQRLSRAIRHLSTAHQPQHTNKHLERDVKLIQALYFRCGDNKLMKSYCIFKKQRMQATYARVLKAENELYCMSGGDCARINNT